MLSSLELWISEIVHGLLLGGLAMFIQYPYIHVFTNCMYVNNDFNEPRTMQGTNSSTHRPI